MHHHTYAASATASVVLDIGGDVGALVLYVPAAFAGREIEISGGTDGARTHAAVRERLLADGSVHCVVYGSLSEGDYTIWADEHTPAGTVTVTGGAITETEWVAPRGSR